MATQVEREKAQAVLDKWFSQDDPAPMKPERQVLFQRLCTKEAERLQFFLTKNVTKKARTELEEWAGIFAKAATRETVPIGLSRSVAPFMGRTLTAYRAGKVQSYIRRPKGKLYEGF